MSILSNRNSAIYLTGDKNTDRLVLSKITDDRELLEFCKINKTIYEKVCDETYFRNRVYQKYPETVKYKDSIKVRDWKNHFLNIVNYKDLLKTDFNYEYKVEDSSPELLYLSRKILDKDEFADEYTKDAALISASWDGHLPVLKYLVEHGADVQADDDQALIFASGNGHLSVVKYLVAQGANIQDQFTKDEALIMASSNGHLQVVKYLIKRGANVEASNNAALIEATEKRHFPVIKYLLQNGADVHTGNDYVLTLARLGDKGDKGDKDILEYLKKYAAIKR